ncbi:MAG: transposase [Gammaproteobacteria bacterium]|nr:transposase [Gammaproteobacteria bacterium]
MIDRRWDGIAACCQPKNKVALGFVEGLNNKIRVLQRRAYGLRDADDVVRPVGRNVPHFPCLHGADVRRATVDHADDAIASTSLAMPATPGYLPTVQSRPESRS